MTEAKRPGVDDAPARLRLPELRLNSPPGYGLAVLCTGLAFALREVIEAVAPGALPYATFFPAVLIAAWAGGLGPGLLALVLSLLAGWYFFVPPRFSFVLPEAAEVGSVALFAATAGMIAVVGAALAKAQREVRASRAETLAALDRQRFLFHELSHRVANGFQIMAGMLHLQRRRMRDPDAAEALGQAADRIGAMALVHRRLYQGAHDIGSQEVAAYLEGLCDDLRAAYFAGLRAQQLVVTAQPGIEVPTDAAIAMGLFVSELVTNATKHAHAPDQPGTITVRFEAAGEQWRLSVADDGRGLAPDFDPARTPGLGMTVVLSQVKQLRGELDIDRTQPGVRFAATFPPPQRLAA